MVVTISGVIATGAMAARHAGAARSVAAERGGARQHARQRRAHQPRALRRVLTRPSVRAGARRSRWSSTARAARPRSRRSSTSDCASCARQAQEAHPHCRIPRRRAATTLHARPADCVRLQAEVAPALSTCSAARALRRLWVCCGSPARSTPRTPQEGGGTAGPRKAPVPPAVRHQFDRRFGGRGLARLRLRARAQAAGRRAAHPRRRRVQGGHGPVLARQVEGTRTAAAAAQGAHGNFIAAVKQARRRATLFLPLTARNLAPISCGLGLGSPDLGRPRAIAGRRARRGGASA